MNEIRYCRPKSPTVDIGRPLLDSTTYLRHIPHE